MAFGPIRMHVSGLKGVEDILRKLPDRVRPAYYNVLRGEANLAITAAQKTVPIRLGELRSSAFVRDTTDKHKRLIQLGYTAPHAAFVHEHPNAHINKDGHPCGCYATIHNPIPGQARNGRGYKWLKKASDEAFAGISQRIVKILRAVLAGNFMPARPALYKPPTWVPFARKSFRKSTKPQKAIIKRELSGRGERGTSVWEKIKPKRKKKK